MIWKHIQDVNRFYHSSSSWFKAIQLGFLIECSKDIGILIRVIKTLDTVFTTKEFIEKNVDYYVFDNALFFRVNNILKKFDFSALVKRHMYLSGKDSLYDRWYVSCWFY